MSGIYIIEFDIYPGLYKIGKSKDILARFNNLKNSTILLDGARLLYYREFDDYTKAEKDIHVLLKQYRCKENREFFNGDLLHFIDIINSLDPNDYRILKLSEDIEDVELGNRAMIYLLKMQINHLEQRIAELEDRQNITYNIIAIIRDIFKKLLSQKQCIAD